MEEERTAPFYLTYEDEEGTVHTVFAGSFKGIMNKASRLAVFSDCFPISNLLVHAGNRTFKYYGWIPDMEVIFFEPATGEIVWDKFYPKWDH